MEVQLITVTEYAKQRQVSKQFVYEYIKKGKLELIELPLFVEYEGAKQMVGTKKFVTI
jgi:predicted DNA-binding protein YlxM (UPF0122 family)